METLDDIVKEMRGHAKDGNFVSGHEVARLADRIEKSANNECKNLWRIGWDFPTDPEDLRALGKRFNDAWIEAVKEGTAPAEDVAPGEPFYTLADCVEKAHTADMLREELAATRERLFQLTKELTINKIQLWNTTKGNKNHED